MTLPCFKCGKTLEPEFRDPNPNVETNHPSRALNFRAHGAYGCTVFDCEPGELEINICDECLVQGSNSRTILYVLKSQLAPVYTRTIWDYRH